MAATNKHTSANSPDDIWLDDVIRVVSPNYNQRPANTPIDLLVIHNISLPAGEFGGKAVEQLFTNCLDCRSHPSFGDLEGLKVSAHLFINRPGEIYQFVALNQRAWHAGQSQFASRDNCNDFSIGIELEGTDDCPYTDAQYQQLVTVTQQLMMRYPGITVEKIVGHSDIAPERKTDPGPAFDWHRYRQALG